MLRGGRDAASRRGATSSRAVIAWAVVPAIESPVEPAHPRHRAPPRGAHAPPARRREGDPRRGRRGNRARARPPRRERPAGPARGADLGATRASCRAPCSSASPTRARRSTCSPSRGGATFPSPRSSARAGPGRLRLRRPGPRQPRRDRARGRGRGRRRRASARRARRTSFIRAPCAEAPAASCACPVSGRVSFEPFAADAKAAGRRDLRGRRPSEARTSSTAPLDPRSVARGRRRGHGPAGRRLPVPRPAAHDPDAGAGGFFERRRGHGAAALLAFAPAAFSARGLTPAAGLARRDDLLLPVAGALHSENTSAWNDPDARARVAPGVRRKARPCARPPGETARGRIPTPSRPGAGGARAGRGTRGSGRPARPRCPRDPRSAGARSGPRSRWRSAGSSAASSGGNRGSSKAARRAYSATTRVRSPSGASVPMQPRRSPVLVQRDEEAARLAEGLRPVRRRAAAAASPRKCASRRPAGQSAAGPARPPRKAPCRHAHDRRLARRPSAPPAATRGTLDDRLAERHRGCPSKKWSAPGITTMRCPSRRGTARGPRAVRRVALADDEERGDGGHAARGAPTRSRAAGRAR